MTPAPLGDLLWLRPVSVGSPRLHLVRDGYDVALCGRHAPEWVGRYGVRPAPLCAGCYRIGPRPLPDPAAQRERPFPGRRAAA